MRKGYGHYVGNRQNKTLLSDLLIIHISNYILNFI